MRWRVGTFEYEFPRPTLVMGIVNVTPDSFSDGGEYLDPSQAIERGMAQMEEGADLIDVGGESTRPMADPVSVSQELKRVLPVIHGLQDRVSIPISIDTMKAEVARAAMESGASLINDVQANRTDPEMWKIAAETGAGYVAMHMQGQPRTMQNEPSYDNVVQEVDLFFQDRLGQMQAAGLDPEQVALDVGLGFGKTIQHNLQLLASLGVYNKWERPLLLGASRKSFIGAVTQTEKPSERVAGSLACACWARSHGVEIIRTHDVSATRQGLRMMEAIMAVEPNV